MDIDSTSTRLCTSGEDCKTKIWDFAALLDPATERADDHAPRRLLASLSDHTGPVNTARFSPCGQKLASGSDDKLVVLYTLRPGPGSAVFGVCHTTQGSVDHKMASALQRQLNLKQWALCLLCGVHAYACKVVQASIRVQSI